MAPVKKLNRLEVKGSGQEFTVHIEADGGNTLELAASRDQLDVLADRLDDILLEDDSADEFHGKE